jgi:serine/threonine-protein kinase
VSDWEIGGYRVVRALSRGGMGEVYVAENAKPGGFSKTVALKILRQEHQDSQNHQRMFEAEAKLAALLNHPNVCTVFDYGHEGDTLYLAMELLDGASLAQLMRDPVSGEQRALPPAIAAAIFAQAARGLDHAHTLRGKDGRALSVVHRDVSPHNIFVTRSGVAKVLDFGIAKTVESGTMTETGMIKGKAGYLAPEQVVSEPLDARTDVFQLGICLWEAMAGEPLFLRGNIYACARAVMDDAVPDLRVLKPDVPVAFVEVAEGALRKRREERTETAMAMADGLEMGMAQLTGAPTASEIGAFVEGYLDARPPAAPAAEVTGPRGRPAGQATAVGRSPNTPTAVARAEAETIGSGEPSPVTAPNVRIAPETFTGEELVVPRPFWQRRSVIVAGLGTLLTGAGLVVARALGEEPADPQPDLPPAPPDPPDPAPAAAVDAGAPAPPVVDAGAAPAPTPTPQPKRRKRRRRRRPPKVDKPPPVEVKPPAETGTGKLAVRALPAADVTVDGKPWGATPTGSRAVSAGRHRVRVVELGTGKVRFDGVVVVPKDGRKVLNLNKK